MTQRHVASPPDHPIALVTGATGFLGANLAAGLVARGWRVRALCRASSSRAALAGLAVEAVTGDVLDPQALARAMEGVTHVFHAAGVVDYWRASAKRMYAVNVEGTAHVMRTALQAGVQRVVHTSSCAVFGVPTPRGRPADEGHPFNVPPARFAYGHSKLMAEDEIQRAVREGLQAVIVNPSAIVGPRDVNFISGSLLREARRGWLKVVPPGGLSLVHVDDVVAGQLAAAEHGVPGERYIVTGEDVPHRVLFPMLCEIVGVPPPRVTVPRGALPFLSRVAWLLERLPVPRLPLDSEQVRMSGEYMYFDGSKARRAFGLTPKPARVALEDAWRWYREQGMA